jgi:CRP-like cAMP-binding protein
MDETPAHDKTRPIPGKLNPESAEARALPQLGVLAGLSRRSLENLSQYGSYERYPAGAELVREGATQDRFYVVVSGELAVIGKSGKKETVLSEAHAGECLGEVSLLEPGAASSTIRAVEDTLVWSMDIHDLRVYILDHAGGAGALLMGMATCLSTRLRQANQLIANHHRLPVETLPEGRERAITATNTVVPAGLFDRLKKTISGTKKIRISTKIKM